MTDSVKTLRHAGLRLGIPAQFAEAEVAEEDGDGERQVKLQIALQRTYLVRPFSATLKDHMVSTPESVYRSDGFLEIVEPLVVERRWPRYGERDARPMGRPVTIDLSVCLRGMFAEDFGKKDLIFVSAAMAADLAVYFIEKLGSDRRPIKSMSFRPWKHSIPVPLDAAIIELASLICHDAPELGAGRLTRTDVLCAATAIHYSSPLYTTDPEKYDGIGSGLKLIQYGPPLPAPPEKTEPDWADTITAVNKGREVTDRLIAPLLDSSIPLVDRANCIFYVFTRTASDDRGWKDAILAIADQLPFRELDDDLRLDLIGAIGGGWPRPRPRKVFDVIGGWGVWPTDASDEILAELADETYDFGALDWYRSYLLMGGLDTARVNEEIERVKVEEALPSRERINQLIAGMGRTDS